MMADGFLSRWSRRKAGKEDDLSKQEEKSAQAPAQIDTEVNGQETQEAPPATLDDVEKIDRFAPDFSSFMKPDVDPAVQQAALKKMFTDPHFNVMDGLDIYIDDYSKPDPLPPGMLERMAQSGILNLFQKADEGVVKAGDQTDRSVTPDNSALEASSESDLTSTQSQELEKSTNLDEMPIESDKKKT
ncbi:DUF3306 domain-containing protein [Polynucleobacter sp. MG-6-Vaara-E2]|uniref:DUF3306 domain-containing protein n=1 Tax=Polynucleobacter sp. MG-6-Vaara-E2 TaxID=2576932 RepID=UPI001BFDD9E0|nr:DUF3306 domain-containing protein [Polynucleobacter sp. MG-6-Vaara-E2]QWD97138.1 DUF3306 domain-containing protein [Polynucleobacter sp. MG-6-Vaara-E2]